MIEDSKDKKNDYLPHVDMHCFACGPDNTSGLKMKFRRVGESLESEVIVSKTLRGWSNLVHGGILTTMLDEIMGWSAIHLTSSFILTKNMAVSFIKPAFIEKPLFIKGYIKERINERKAIMASEIKDEDGDLCVKAEGEFVLFSPEEFKKLGIVPDDLLEDMTLMFAKHNLKN